MILVQFYMRVSNRVNTKSFWTSLDVTKPNQCQKSIKLPTTENFSDVPKYVRIS